MNERRQNHFQNCNIQRVIIESYETKLIRSRSMICMMSNWDHTQLKLWEAWLKKVYWKNIDKASHALYNLFIAHTVQRGDSALQQRWIEWWSWMRQQYFYKKQLIWSATQEAEQKWWIRHARQQPLSASKMDTHSLWIWFRPWRKSLLFSLLIFQSSSS